MVFSANAAAAAAGRETTPSSPLSGPQAKQQYRKLTFPAAAAAAVTTKKPKQQPPKAAAAAPPAAPKSTFIRKLAEAAEVSNSWEEANTMFILEVLGSSRPLVPAPAFRPIGLSPPPAPEGRAPGITLVRSEPQPASRVPPISPAVSIADADSDTEARWENLFLPPPPPAAAAAAESAPPPAEAPVPSPNLIKIASQEKRGRRRFRAFESVTKWYTAEYDSPIDREIAWMWLLQLHSSGTQDKTSALWADRDIFLVEKSPAPAFEDGMLYVLAVGVLPSAKCYAAILRGIARVSTQSLHPIVTWMRTDAHTVAVLHARGKVPSELDRDTRWLSFAGGAFVALAEYKAAEEEVFEGLRNSIQQLSEDDAPLEHAWLRRRQKEKFITQKYLQYKESAAQRQREAVQQMADFQRKKLAEMDARQREEARLRREAKAAAAPPPPPIIPATSPDTAADLEPPKPRKTKAAPPRKRPPKVATEEAAPPPVQQPAKAAPKPANMSPDDIREARRFASPAAARQQPKSVSETEEMLSVQEAVKLEVMMKFMEYFLAVSKEIKDDQHFRTAAQYAALVLRMVRRKLVPAVKVINGKVFACEETAVAVRRVLGERERQREREQPDELRRLRVRQNKIVLERKEQWRALDPQQQSTNLKLLAAEQLQEQQLLRDKQASEVVHYWKDAEANADAVLDDLKLQFDAQQAPSPPPPPAS